ncbi:MAG TPA: hypothetical protein VF604_01060 [Pyrinomonadaceae bacterium]|jgi:phosphoglycerol transferase MdoB-like AlkP superfamily enzyme
MRYVIWIIFALSFLVLNICLLMPIGSRGMSWEEAALGIIPAAPVALICFVLLAAGVGAKGRSRAWRLWAAALLWSLLIGGIVTFSTYSSYSSNISTIRNDHTPYNQRKSPETSLAESYSIQDRIGILYGLLVLGFAGISFLGLLIAFFLRKKPQNLNVEQTVNNRV